MFSWGAQSAVDRISPPMISLPSGDSAESLTDAPPTWTEMLTWTSGTAASARGQLLGERVRQRHHLVANGGGRAVILGSTRAPMMALPV